MSIEKVIDIKNLSVTYQGDTGSVNAVKSISFHLNKGEVLGIVGESGSGKSTVAKAIMRLLNEKHSSLTGDIHFKGQNLLALKQKAMNKIRGKDISMIFQNPMTSLNPYIKVWKQISETSRLHQGTAANQAKEIAINLLESVGIPDPANRSNQYPHEFSGGMRQRAMIASAISCEPDILIADEPTTALDVIIQAQVLRLMKEMLKEHDTSMILITHDLGIVAGVCDRVLVMKDGEIVEEADVTKLYSKPAHDYTKNLLSAVPRIDQKRPAVQLKSDVIMSIKNLSVEYLQSKGFFKRKSSAFHAVKNVSFDLHKGEVFGLVGQSGSGKSTLVRAILQLVESSTGEVMYEGQNILNYTAQQLRESRRKMQMIFQDPYASLNSRMTIRQIITEPLKNFNIVPANELNTEVARLLQLVSLQPEMASRFPHEFSGGQRQRICIARALALKPEILFCDEPVSALDVSIQADIIELLKKLKDEMGLSILFISHDLAVVKDLCDRVAVMNHGEIVELLPANEIYTNAKNDYTKSLLEAIPIPDPNHRLV